ncbi:hypothetical protein, partial [Thiolapillus sp.]|uniref:hypothetical protein n=1 Tax=Thiolapillus sp. TaxID=2017437 RepID=UPI003AF552B1
LPAFASLSLAVSARVVPGAGRTAFRAGTFVIHVFDPNIQTRFVYLQFYVIDFPRTIDAQ